ncbi:hypothetical protein [Clavibacter zhangzhiyongii]|uniref:hypothetical protein n=1 Tax=Clavibacter zhangzhiyongii TaxID=2768071 RepID=UPI0039DFEBBE
MVLSGAPGVGKSSMAVEAAHRIADGTRPRLFADLGGLDDAPAEPLQVVRSLLRQLTGAEAGRGDLATAVAAWARATAARPAVVVLDDAADEAQVRPVMAADPATTVLVTSRRALAGLAGSRHLRVPDLPRADGIALLEAIIPAAQRAGADLDELARLCGDLPLALRVAGHRIASQPAWHVEDHVRRLRAEGRRLGALVAGDTGVQAAFAASCAHLTPAARDLFRSLSLLRGSSFAAPMAGALLGLDDEAVEALLDELVDLGLVEALGGSRHRLHDLLRLYAAERLHHDVEPVEVRRRAERLGRWTLATAAAAGRAFGPDDAPDPRLGPALAFASRAEARAWLVAEVDAWYPEYEAASRDGREGLVLDAFPHLLHFGDRWFEWGRWHELFGLTAEVAHRMGRPPGGRGAQRARLHAVLRAMGCAGRAGDLPARARPRDGERRPALPGAGPLGHRRGPRRARRPRRRGGLLPPRDRRLRGAGPPGAGPQPARDAGGAPAGGGSRGGAGGVPRDPRADGRAPGAHAGARPLGRAPRRDGPDGQGAHPAGAPRGGGRARGRDARRGRGSGDAEHGTDRDRARALRNRGLARRGLGERAGARHDLERALVLAGDRPPAGWSAEIREALDGLPGGTA